MNYVRSIFLLLPMISLLTACPPAAEDPNTYLSYELEIDDNAPEKDEQGFYEVTAGQSIIIYAKATGPEEEKAKWKCKVISVEETEQADQQDEQEKEANQREKGAIDINIELDKQLRTSREGNLISEPLRVTLDNEWIPENKLPATIRFEFAPVQPKREDGEKNKEICNAGNQGEFNIKWVSKKSGA